MQYIKLIKKNFPILLTSTLETQILRRTEKQSSEEKGNKGRYVLSGYVWI